MLPPFALPPPEPRTPHPHAFYIGGKSLPLPNQGARATCPRYLIDQRGVPKVIIGAMYIHNKKLTKGYTVKSPFTQRVYKSIALPLYYWSEIDRRSLELNISKAEFILSIFKSVLGEVPKNAHEEAFYKRLEDNFDRLNQRFLDDKKVGHSICLSNVLWDVIDQQMIIQKANRPQVIAEAIKRAYLQK